MKEAGRTSLLSKRWRYMWTYIEGLNFDASHIINALELGEKELEVERRLYLNWVNQVLKSYNGTSLDEFRVLFDLDDESCKFDIDNWVNFAIEKRVKRLELDLSPCSGISVHSLSLGFTSCNSLTNLLLTNVNVTGQVLEYFLTNCPFLEQLSVSGSNSLVNLKVPDLALKLKRLGIIYCFDVESIEISAMNLVSFEYFGPKISQPFKNVKEPVELCIGGEYCDYLIYNFFEISNYLSQLESLTLHATFYEISIRFPKFPVFNKLKQLELRVTPDYLESLVVFAPLIEACPFLCKFVLQLHWGDSTSKRRNLEKVTSRPHHYLKEVEFIGWVGRADDFELAIYVIKSAVMLEKITFDPRSPLLIGTPWEFTETLRKKAARKRARHFQTKLPAGAALVIL
ncbi:F-box/FBD/LRR-repeat protein At4g26340-like isoform X2 [Cornus florida]|nr:F-box/FBD/LRR-repeat protein At4g26340-like isoform X2 [Cornus florida]